MLYIGDRDLAGDDIEASTRSVLARARGWAFDPGTWERLAITQDQADDLRARGVEPILKTDSRFSSRRPHEAFEAEALGQTEIERLVRTRLDELLPEPLPDVLARERSERAELQAMLDGLGRR